MGLMMKGTWARYCEDENWRLCWQTRSWIASGAAGQACMSAPLFMVILDGLDLGLQYLYMKLALILNLSFISVEDSVLYRILHSVRLI